MRQFLGSGLTQAMLNFSLTIVNDIGSLLVFFQAERPLSVWVFLYENFKEVDVSLLQRVTQPVVQENSIRKLNRILVLILIITSFKCQYWF